MSRTIKCPECGQSVQVEDGRTLPTHDGAPPCRALCRASGGDVAHLLAWLDESIAAERAAIREVLLDRYSNLQPCDDSSFAVGLLEAIALVDARSNGGES